MTATDRPDRRSARLFTLGADGGSRHLPRTDLARLFRPGDLVVANDAATLPVVDRLGQSAVMVPATVVSVAAFLVLIAAANGDWPAWTLFLAALAAAAMPSIPAMVRARWSELFRDRPELNTAYAFESAADELVYIAGASPSVGLAVSLFPEAGMLASTALLAAGTAAFLLQRSTEPKVRHWGGGVPQGPPSGYARCTHHAHAGLRRRDLRDGRSQRGRDHRAARPAGGGEPRHRRLRGRLPFWVWSSERSTRRCRCSASC